MYFIMELTHKYLEKIGFSVDTESTNFGEIFLNIITINDEINNNILIPFIFYKNEDALFKFYLNEWNKNEINYFIAVGSDRSYIINAKEKTKSEDILKSSLIIDNFDYGTDTIDYNDIKLETLPYTKENIDNSYFFDYVLKKQKEVKNEVDTYLLNNLVALKEELSKFDTDNENINGLILKSLFVKYLEDRKILAKTSIAKVLEEGNPSALTELFSKIAVINGDILKKDLRVTEKHINELKIFYTHDYKEYKKGQQNLFYPYKFNKIPIQLISNVYEEFLGRTNKEEKKSKGIFYTKTFVIDFMLSHTIYPKIEKQSHSTILDPACGSGAFLVQAFNRILKSQLEKNLSIDEKAEILQKQIFGIDTDVNALQITAFSLYLTLLDGISKNEIQEQLKKRNPILPSLIGYNLLQRNTIVDDIKFEIKINSNIYSFTKFDCIVANPPWSQLDKKENIVRNEIDKLDIYRNVYNYQTSQAFLLKIDKLCHTNTDIAIIVNNSNFLNEKSKEFRIEILEKYRLKYFYELSEIADIIFKGTKHPSAVLILDKKDIKTHAIKYISPRLSKFSKILNIISFSSKDIREVKQENLKQEDILWKIFVNGNWKDYQLISKIILNNSFSKEIRCQRGFEALQENKMVQIKSPIKHSIYNTNDKTNYFIIDKLNSFIWNRKLRRLPLPKIFSDSYFKKHILDKLKSDNDKKLIQKYYKKTNEEYISTIIRDYKTKLEIDYILSRINQSLFSGKRIIIERQPSSLNKIKAIYAETKVLSKDNTLILKVEEFNNYNILLAILNSSLTGYFFTNVSSQFSKGGRSSLSVTDISKFPFPKVDINNSIVKKIQNKVVLIKEYKGLNRNTIEIEKQLDELIFDLYGLLEFEKEIIREFYQINVERKNNVVETQDIQNYVEAFRDTYQLMIKKNLRLNASYIISTNIGTIVEFSIVDKEDFISEIKYGNFTQRQVLNLVKELQIQKELLNGSINEEKVKIYEENIFYIIKSNQFKDWTKRQAMEDANEEVKEMLKKLL
jgi:type I restriction-modification system DNA methylase subunit